MEGQPATVVVIRESGSQPDDRVLALHEDRAAPGAVVANRLKEPGGLINCMADETVVFVQSGIVKEQLSQCERGKNDVAVFSSKQAMAYRKDVDWQSGDPGGTEIDVTDAQSAPRELKVAIWIGVPEGTSLEDKQEISEIVEREVDLANSIFGRHRVGIEVSVEDQAPKFISIDWDTPYGCSDQMGGHTGGVLNVYYVNKIGYEGLQMAWRGANCPGTEGAPDDKIFIAWTSHSETTLVHELGHALSLVVPGTGHTDEVAGFGPNNSMWSGADDGGENPRDHFSLGQAFRMNMDRFSWLNHLQGGGAAVMAEDSATATAAFEVLDCQCMQFSTTPCSRLATDITPPPSGVNSNEDRWYCSDEIAIPYADQDDNAESLLHGRRRASDPEVCEWVLGETGKLENVDGLLLWFPNLVTATDCDPVYTVFFDNHRMWYRDAPTDWTNKYRDKRSANNVASDVPQPRLSVPVHVWIPGDETSVNLDGVSVAKDVYSGTIDTDHSNLVGVDLEFVVHDMMGVSALSSFVNFIRAGCNTALTMADGFQVGAVNVYYDPTAGASTNDHCLVTDTGGNPLAGTGFVVLGQDPSDGDLSHEIGHVFGLGDVTSGDGFEDTNVMLPTPTSSVDTRKHLTLGQAFRINVSPDSWLKRSPLSESKLDAVDCDKPDTICPLLTADGRRPQ
jgi:hypothetical protein